MPFTLPRLTWDIDCEPLGYPGLQVTFWLNPPVEPEPEPEAEPAPKGKKPQPWEAPFYASLARIIERITVPGAYTESGVEEVAEVRSSRDVWEFERHDPQVLTWVLRQYSDQRQERLKVEAKN